MKYRIEYRHHGYGEMYEDETPRSLTYQENTDCKIRCCNRNCNGEYNLRALDLSQPRSFLICHGTEGSPQRKRIYRKCANTLECFVTPLPDEGEQ